MEELRNYLRTFPGGVEAFARKVGVTKPAIYHYLSGHRRPRPKIALKIERITGGAVKKEKLIW